VPEAQLWHAVAAGVPMHQVREEGYMSTADDLLPKADPFPIAFWFIVVPSFLAAFVILLGWVR